MHRNRFGCGLSMRHGTAAIIVMALVTAESHVCYAAPPAPSGGHPRLFMSAAEQAAYSAAAAKSGTAAHSLVSNCQDAVDKPSDVATRGGADGNNWPGTAVDCAFAYRATQNPSYLTAAIKYWTAALSDDQNIGDGLGCVPGVDTNWQSWASSGSGPTPPIIITVTHDTGYPMRWYSPYIALTYDWLHDAPGVDDALRGQTRTCLTAWVDYYTQNGYHHDEVGANYNAGFVIGKTLTAVALGGENGADGDRMWTETVDDVFGKLLVGQGLLGSADPVGKPAGVMVGGDWGEGWQYGPLSVMEYAVATRAVETAGAAEPEMDAWVNSLVDRYIYASVPHGDGVFNSNGDFDSSNVYPSANAGPLDAVLAGPSNDRAAGFAAFVKTKQGVSGDGVYNAFAEARSVTAADYAAQSPAPPLWYLARGTRTVFARTSWTPDAFYGVFSSPPQVNSDHHHFSAGNLVFSRGGDHLIVDPSNYGEPGTLETNAPTVDSPGVSGNYAPSQTPWSQAELLWARATADGVVAARGDLAKAFMDNNDTSDIAYARRDWVMLPEGEMVTIDRADTADASHFLYVGFHANSAGTLALHGADATGTVGGSKVVIHGAVVSGATAAITQPPIQDNYDYPCGACTNARFAVDYYQIKIPGPKAIAVHVIDALGASEAPAEIGSLNDDNFDPAPKQNQGVLGAAVYRSQKQSYVVASSAARGTAGSTMTYGVPGASAARHVVVDAPEGSDGQSAVSAVAEGTRCVVTITAGAGIAGRPLMFTVKGAADGCTVSASTDVASGSPPLGGGVPRAGNGGASAGGGSGSAGGQGGALSGSGSASGPAVGPGGPAVGPGGGGAPSGAGGAPADAGTNSGSTADNGFSCRLGGRSGRLPAPTVVVLVALGFLAAMGRHRRRRPGDFSAT